MMRRAPTVDRRALLRAALAAPLAAPFVALRARAADEPLEIGWPDLIPDTVESLFRNLPSMGVMGHGAISMMPGAEAAFTATNDALKGKRIKMPGFIVPLEMSGEGVSTLLLVPFVGACIHVPPPPPNQLVYVTLPAPYPDGGLFDPVWVTGVLDVAPTTTYLADVGYVLEAERMEPYDG